jgi:hypothetical protein
MARGAMRQSLIAQTQVIQALLYYLMAGYYVYIGEVLTTLWFNVFILLVHGGAKFQLVVRQLIPQALLYYLMVGFYAYM